uniref:Putative translation initiation factor if-2 n=1 Tax=Amblyomma parvum TaxID=251391 RepID=A0A023G2D6_AMBPA
MGSNILCVLLLLAIIALSECQPRPAGIQSSYGSRQGGSGRRPGGTGPRPGGTGPRPGGTGPRPGGSGPRPGSQRRRSTSGGSCGGTCPPNAKLQDDCSTGTSSCYCHVSWARGPAQGVDYTALAVLFIRRVS